MSRLDEIVNHFGSFTGYLNEKYRRAKRGLQAQIAETVTNLVIGVMQPMLLQYIEAPIKLKDGTTVQGQSSFDRLVREDKDIVAMIEHYRPSYNRYINQARRFRDYIDWNSRRFAVQLAVFLDENGIVVTQEGDAFIYRTVERFRRKIYG